MTGKGCAILFTYSSTSIIPLKRMVNGFLEALGIEETSFDDLFHYGVFCKTETYANYKWSYTDTQKVDVPEMLTSGLNSHDTKSYFVENLMRLVITGQVNKPEWMIFIEQEEMCYEGYPPSTFITLMAKDERFEKLTTLITEFLYSPAHKAAVFDGCCPNL